MASSIVVIAPDSFKGTLGAAEAARAIAEGWSDARPADTLILLPMADGGEGTLDAFAAAVPGAERMPITVRGADDRAIQATWLRLPAAPDAPRGTAVVELAATSGIERLDRLRPLTAHTYGLGEAIRAALSAGVSRVVVGLGSSASTDGGSGMLRALGLRLLDEQGMQVGLGGACLDQVAVVEDGDLVELPQGGVVGLTDVTNPLLGSAGAAAVFGPQKGADAAQIAQLEKGLTTFAALLPHASTQAPGAGAAGGTGFGLLSWGATLNAGSAAVAELIGLPEAVGAASIVITGEGSYDAQSAAGKVAAYVASLAGAARVALVAGRITDDADTSAFAATVSLSDLAGSSEMAMAHTPDWLRVAAGRLARDLDGPAEIGPLSS